MSEEAQTRLLEDALILKNRKRSEKIVNHNVDLKQWKIVKLYKDCLWVKLIDEPDASTVMKNGIILGTSQAKGIYSLGEVLMCGDEVKYATEGQRVLFIKQVGQPAHRSVDGYKTHFVREDAVMAVMEFEGTEEEMHEDIKNQILLGE